ncbi:MAG: hypothetical protein RBT36_11225 [Desulfobulbus sp.]|nr:hypothetical protein [Desulfobulbus sp.]
MTEIFKCQEDVERLLVDAIRTHQLPHPMLSVRYGRSGGRACQRERFHPQHP